MVPSTGNRLPRDTAVHTETAVTSGRPCRACFSPGSLPGQPAAMLGGCSSSLWEPHLVRNGGLLPTRTLGCVLQPQQPPETLSPPPNSPSGITAWTDGHSVGWSSVASPQSPRLWVATLSSSSSQHPPRPLPAPERPACVPPRLAGWWETAPRRQAPFRDPCHSQAGRTSSLTRPCSQRAFPGPGVSAAWSGSGAASGPGCAPGLQAGS